MIDSSITTLPDMALIWQQTLNWQPTVEQQALFQRLYELILSGNSQLNLTRITDPQEFWEKHLWDSLIALKGVDNISPPHSPELIDIGTGAGFPGIPIAIAYPNCSVTFLDSTRKKINYIETMLSELGLKGHKTLVSRVEETARASKHREKYDFATIRAVGTASVCAEYALPLVKRGGQAIVYRGTWTQEETIILENAVQQLGGEIESIVELVTPISNSIRHCIYLRKVAPTPAKFPRGVGIPTQKPLL